MSKNAALCETGHVCIHRRFKSKALLIASGVAGECCVLDNSRKCSTQTELSESDVEPSMILLSCPSTSTSAS